jgi:hypothetical protein
MAEGTGILQGQEYPDRFCLFFNTLAHARIVLLGDYRSERFAGSL